MKKTNETYFFVFAFGIYAQNNGEAVELFVVVIINVVVVFVVVIGASGYAIADDETAEALT